MSRFQKTKSPFFFQEPWHQFYRKCQNDSKAGFLTYIAFRENATFFCCTSEYFLGSLRTALSLQIKNCNVEGCESERKFNNVLSRCRPSRLIEFIKKQFGNIREGFIMFKSMSAEPNIRIYNLLKTKSEMNWAFA